MKINKVRIGDIIHNTDEDHERRWKVVSVYNNVILTRNAKVPEIKRCFNFGDLVLLGIEHLGFNYDSLLEQQRKICMIEGRAKHGRRLLTGRY